MYGSIVDLTEIQVCEHLAKYGNNYDVYQVRKTQIQVWSQPDAVMSGSSDTEPSQAADALKTLHTLKVVSFV